ncbi:MAG TPA: sensor histidine kinase [Tepidisphaeraceae bacterium]|jgi:signal transduction histidine kinase|nr:sensor histidine kinase [Tepidisphaeraceae bacterium]
MLLRGPRILERTWSAAVIGAALLLLVGYIDWLTGPELAFAQFYLLPVSLYAWYIGKRSGYVMAALGALAWMYVDALTSPHQHEALYWLWNGIVRGVFFVFAVEVVTSWKTTGTRLAMMVDERTTALKAEIAQRVQAQASLQKLGAQISAAEEAERRRVAYEIHDAVSQMLSLVKINLEAARSEPPSDVGRGARLTDCAGMVDQLIHQTRTLTFELHPAMLDDLGLVATLREFSREFEQRTGAEVTISEFGKPQSLPSSLNHYLFRSTKELFNNAVKHGRAKEIIAAVHWETAGLRIVIDDDGSGFDSAEALAPQSRRGLGLPGIRERLNNLGGEMQLDSRLGQGTRVILEVPLPAQVEG